MAISAVFVVLSTQQIIDAVFGMGVSPLPGLSSTSTSTSTSPAPVSGGACAGGIRRLDAALDRAASLAAAARSASEEAAMNAFRASLSPDWDGQAAVFASCASEPHGPDAVAALLRLRMGLEQVVRRQAVEIAPLRHDVSAYLGR